MTLTLLTPKWSQVRQRITHGTHFFCTTFMTRKTTATLNTSAYAPSSLSGPSKLAVKRVPCYTRSVRAVREQVCIPIPGQICSSREAINSAEHAVWCFFPGCLVAVPNPSTASERPSTCVHPSRLKLRLWKSCACASVFGFGFELPSTWQTGVSPVIFACCIFHFLCFYRRL